MNWLDQSRRDEFEQRDRLRRQVAPESAKIDRKLDHLLPDDIRKQSLAIGNELIVPYEHALRAVDVANNNAIAVLGFDAGEVVEDGFKILDYSGYDSAIAYNGDWGAYVSSINVQAKRWLETHHMDRNHGYILTSASQNEFDQAREAVEHP
jgi:hypothetical protein